MEKSGFFVSSAGLDFGISGENAIQSVNSALLVPLSKGERCGSCEEKVMNLSKKDYLGGGLAKCPHCKEVIKLANPNQW